MPRSLRHATRLDSRSSLCRAAASSRRCARCWARCVPTARRCSSRPLFAPIWSALRATRSPSPCASSWATPATPTRT
eukprot:5845026-Pleurochrysis_carterae.AAC.1